MIIYLKLGRINFINNWSVNVNTIAIPFNFISVKKRRHGIPHKNPRAFRNLMNRKKLDNVIRSFPNLHLYTRYFEHSPETWFLFSPINN